ncbi:MAG: OmpA family protein [Candidatus Omnitrophica bacterium]|nr:OmpA family protein [Candidatus Omnitrophota bacterium]
MKKHNNIYIFVFFVSLSVFLSGCVSNRQEKRQQKLDELQKQFSWWPTDAKPAPVKDPEHGGYWWWPKEPGNERLWGNRGYCFVRKIIFDYKEEELPAPKPQELRPSLLIKKVIKNVKVYFDFNKSGLRDDAVEILRNAVLALNKNPGSEILITGNCDIRGSEKYNEKLGKKRAAAVKNFMLENGIPEERIKIVSRGKLDAVAHVTDLVGMQKDRNAQFMVAEVEEIMLPYEGKLLKEARQVEQGKYIEEKTEEVEGEVKVSTREYTIKKNDSLWKIAQKELGNGHRWKYLYELNKDRIKNPNNLKSGRKIIIPVE